MVYVTRRESFSSAHRLNNLNLSDEENKAIFGKCNNSNGHGHNYVIEVVVAGEIDPVTGYVFDLKKLKEIMNENIIAKVDHKNLDLDVDFLKGIISTTENLAVAFWKQLADKIPAGKLHSVKLYETENNYIEYKGE